MPISINGSGTITGISVGGLPDGIVDADMLAADSITAPKIGTKTFVSYAIIADQKASNEHGGSFTQDGDRTRDLNTEITDPDGIVSISNNQFTLQAGTYLIRGYASAYAVYRNLAWVYDVTGSANLPSFGTAEYGAADQHRSLFLCRKTISSANVFEIRHRCQTSRATNGFGVATNIATSTYTFVEIFKEA